MNRKFCSGYKPQNTEGDDKRPGNSEDNEDGTPDTSKRPRLNAERIHKDKIFQREEQMQAKSMATVLKNRMEANDGLIVTVNKKPTGAQKIVEI